MFSHSKSSPPEKLTAYPQLGWTRYSNTGGSIHGGGLLESAYGAGSRCTPQGGSTVTVWRS